MKVLEGALFVDVLSHEGSQLLRVLQCSWYLDRAGPIHVVEALTVYQLLDDAFFQLRVGVCYSVVGGLDCSSVALLSNEVELEVFADCL